ncbi:MAG: short-chain dehydrogenase [Alphaproteobacteria bacterium TMED87]|nr:short-chain dehydrogenase [Rhodospirillaceae bacterium]OUV10101.1 MAG: short-chain dehydrogenase [Alphaproteobacteria bacterium TMED87]
MYLFNLSGKVAIVTGSSRGIGKSIARSLSEAGAKVVITSRDSKACNDVAKEINSGGGKAIAFSCNVSDKLQVKNLIKECHSQLGPVDILVCNAASNPAYGPMAEVEDSIFEKIMKTNLQGPMWLINFSIPDMIKNGGGSIILISSVVANSGSKFIGTYAMSKAAMNQMTRNYALELGEKNIRVNSIAPGLVKTHFAKALWEGKGGKKWEQNTPLKRLAEPEDISGAAIFLASEASKYVTGQTIVVDGGFTITDGS